MTDPAPWTPSPEQVREWMAEMCADPEGDPQYDLPRARSLLLRLAEAVEEDPTEVSGGIRSCRYCGSSDTGWEGDRLGIKHYTPDCPVLLARAVREGAEGAS